MSLKSSADPTSRSPRILEERAIASLLDARRWDDALAKLGEAQTASPRDAEIADAIRIVRDRALAASLERLGGADAVAAPTGTGALLAGDEKYVLGLVSGSTAIDELVAMSTLGRHRTVRALASLLDGGSIRMNAPSRGIRAPEATSTAKHIVVADGHASSAALTRTMLRLVLGSGAYLETVTTTAQLAACAAKQRPDLLVTELTLIDGDVLPGVRAVRRTVGHPVPVLMITSRVELELATGRAPERCAVLARPIDKAGLVEALASLGVTRKS